MDRRAGDSSRPISMPAVRPDWGCWATHHPGSECQPTSDRHRDTYPEICLTVLQHTVRRGGYDLPDHIRTRRAPLPAGCKPETFPQPHVCPIISVIHAPLSAPRHDTRHFRSRPGTETSSDEAASRTRLSPPRGDTTKSQRRGFARVGDSSRRKRDEGYRTQWGV
jgi:hypothetical protein